MSVFPTLIGYFSKVKLKKVYFYVHASTNFAILLKKVIQFLDLKWQLETLCDTTYDLHYNVPNRKL